jgi:hypothetical protein
MNQTSTHRNRLADTELNSPNHLRVPYPQKHKRIQRIGNSEKEVQRAASMLPNIEKMPVKMVDKADMKAKHMATKEQEIIKRAN